MTATAAPPTAAAAALTLIERFQASQTCRQALESVLARHSFEDVLRELAVIAGESTYVDRSEVVALLDEAADVEQFAGADDDDDDDAEDE
jgi:7-keto-8-aminopelargonate synthetase-like enzyme